MAQVGRSLASLRIMGEDLVPDEISHLLGCQPTYAQTRGETLVGKKSGRARIAQFGMWRLVSAARQPEDLDGQIDELLSKLTDSPDVWADLAKRFELDLFCGLFMTGSNEGLVLSPGTLLALGSRGIEMGFDIYGADEDDAPP